MNKPYKSPHKKEVTAVGTVAGAVELSQTADGSAFCLFFYLNLDRADKAGGFVREKVQIWATAETDKQTLKTMFATLKKGATVQVIGTDRCFDRIFTLDTGKKKIVPEWFIEAHDIRRIPKE